MKQVNYETKDLYAVKVELPHDMEKYAMTFLGMFNTVKSQKNLIKIENDYEWGVTVYCVEEKKDDLVEWMKGFGEIISVEKVQGIVIDINEFEYDFDEYDDIVGYFEY